MDELKMSDIPVVSTGKAIETLANMYSNIINLNINLSSAPSVMLWGQPGVGKSQSVREIANEIERKTGKKVNTTDVRLILFSPIDLRGIPTANEDKSLAIWLKPKIFQMDSSNKVINILFLDEITSAPQSVQAAAYQITLEKRIGEHRLADNCIVIAAGNRMKDKSVTYQMPKALANRLLHFELDVDFISWNKWAIAHNIHKYVLSFLKFKPNYLNNFESNINDLAFCTPRSWEMVSNVLKYEASNLENAFVLITGLIGKGVAIEFSNYLKIYTKLPNIENIFKGTETLIPKELDVLYALVASMIDYAKVHKNDVDLIANSINYAMNLPIDFATILLKDYMYIEPNYKLKLLKIPEFYKWINEGGRLLDEAYR